MIGALTDHAPAPLALPKPVRKSSATLLVVNAAGAAVISESPRAKLGVVWPLGVKVFSAGLPAAGPT